MRPIGRWMSMVMVLAAGLLRAGALPAGPVVWLEAESFEQIGGWSNDSQHVDLMGSPYLLATGLGKPVADAVTTAHIPQDETYRLWVRCRDWLPGHSPGRFVVRIGKQTSAELGIGAGDDSWKWVCGGRFELKRGPVEVRLIDRTGWWGRCDAVVLGGGDFVPSNKPDELAAQRVKYGGVSAEVETVGPFDVVVVGAGPAGMGAATAAARNGARVALIQDRQVVGGNSSSEIQVPPMGYIGKPPDKVNVTGLCEEFFPEQGWQNFADSRHMEKILRAERNLSLFLNTRATGVEMVGAGPPRPLAPGQAGRPGRIAAVRALEVTSGRRMRFTAPLFIDCTGHGWIGYYAGAEYRQGEESRDEFGESLAPLQATPRTQGNTLYKAVIVDRGKPVKFDCPPWAYQWKKNTDFEPLGSHRRLGSLDIRRPPNFDLPSHGKGRNPGADPNGGTVYKWWVEYGGMLDTIADAERIRDELFRICLGLWNYAKNYDYRTVRRNATRELVWLNYVPGVRESRRLMGPYIMTQHDFDRPTIHRDVVAFTDWGIDVHHPEGFWVRGNDCIHVYHGRRVGIPYRSLYSRNIENLLMAGRCLSATHLAMGGTRVMRPCMGMGQAAGTAAAIAARFRTTPAGVYEQHLDLLQQILLKDGCYLPGITNHDPADLARRARVTASSSTPDAPPAKVIDGYNRIVNGDRHAWQAAGQEGPVWLALAFDRPTAVNAVHVTFEQKPAPLIVQVHRDGAWTDVTKKHSPSRRRTVVRFETVQARRIRLVLDRPVGLCEVRLYNEPAR